MLETDRLSLRKLDMADKDDIVRNINEEFIYNWTLKIPYPYHEKDFMDYLEMTKKSDEEGTYIHLTIHLKGTDEGIGGIGLMDIKKEEGLAEIGYWISKDYRGKGLVPEAIGEIVRYGFEELGLYRIEAVIFAENVSSRRVLEKSGFTFEGTIRGRYLKECKRIDGRMYSILRTDQDISGIK
jgi:ribosomal-protein-alanine N-acetyltransferase